jgi:hypothetical protein
MMYMSVALTAAVIPDRPLGRPARVVQTPVEGSNRSLSDMVKTVVPFPPMAYNIEETTATAKFARAVGMSGTELQEDDETVYASIVER